ncbi:agmatine deiminase family protein [Streptomyces sp. NBC_00048]
MGEGGSLETDGQGTLLATVSSLANSNRNPGRTQDQVEQAMKTALGIGKVIGVPGLAGQDITDCHIDCLARFTAPGQVILDKPGSRSTKRPSGPCRAPPTPRAAGWPSPNCPARTAATSAGAARTSCPATPTTTP